MSTFTSLWMAPNIPRNRANATAFEFTIANSIPGEYTSQYLPPLLQNLQTCRGILQLSSGHRYCMF